MEFLIKYNYGVFDKNVNYGASDKIIATMNRIMKAIKYNVNIAMC